MAIEISLKKSTANPTSASGLTLAEPVFNYSNNTLWIGKGSGNSPVWVGAGVCGASGGIAAGLTTQLPTHAAVKNYFDAVSSSFLGATVSYVATFNGATGAVTGVSSFNGLTGAVTGASLGANTFTGLQTLNAGLTTSFAHVSGGLTVGGSLYVNGNLTVSGGVTTSISEIVLIEDNIITLNSNVTGTPTENAGVEIERGTSANTQILWNESTDKWTFTNDGTLYYDIPTDYVSSFNGLTGAIQGVSSWNGQTGAVSFVNYVASFNGNTGTVQGVSAAVAGTGISVSGATGSVTITNTGVQSLTGTTNQITVSGSTGAVTLSLPSTIAGSGTALTLQSGNDIPASITLTGVVIGTPTTAVTGNLTVSSGFTASGIAQFASGVTFASTTDYTGTARFAGAVVLSSTLSGTTSSFSRVILANAGVCAAGITTSTITNVTDIYARDFGATAGLTLMASPGVGNESYIHLRKTTSISDLGLLDIGAGTVQITPIGGAIGSNPSLKLRMSDGDFSYNWGIIGSDNTILSADRTYDLPDASGFFVLDSNISSVAVTSFNGNVGAVQGVSAAVAGTGISVSGATGSVTITNIGVQSFNGRTGAVQGVSSAAAGTGISISAATGAITITNTGVQTFNGLTGAVTGVTVGGANTFTALNSFAVGISSNGGTFSANTRFLSGIQTDSVLSTTGAGGTVYINSDSNGNGGNSITYIGDWDGANNGTSITVDDQTASINLNGEVSCNNAVIATSFFTTGDVYFGGASAFLSSQSTTLGTTAANQTIASVSVYDVDALADTNRTVEFFVQASHSSGYEALKVMAIHDGTNTYNTQYGLIRSGSSLCSSYTTTIATIGGGSKVIRLRATPTNTNTTFKVIETVIPA
jgi:hypothetical protein